MILKNTQTEKSTGKHLAPKQVKLLALIFLPQRTLIFAINIYLSVQSSHIRLSD